MPVLTILLIVLAVSVNGNAKANGAINDGDNKNLSNQSKRQIAVYINSELGQSDTVYQDSYIPKDTANYPNPEKTALYKTGKEEDMLAFIEKNIVYPKSAIDNNVSAYITVQFVVDETGKIINVEVVRVNVSPDNDRRASNTAALSDLKAEAIRVVSLLDFIPAKQAGKNVKVQFTLPVNFVTQSK